MTRCSSNSSSLGRASCTFSLEATAFLPQVLSRWPPSTLHQSFTGPWKTFKVLKNSQMKVNFALERWTLGSYGSLRMVRYMLLTILTSRRRCFSTHFRWNTVILCSMWWVLRNRLCLRLKIRAVSSDTQQNTILELLFQLHVLSPIRLVQPLPNVAGTLGTSSALWERGCSWQLTRGVSHMHPCWGTTLLLGGKLAQIWPTSPKPTSPVVAVSWNGAETLVSIPIHQKLIPLHSRFPILEV